MHVLELASRSSVEHMQVYKRAKKKGKIMTKEFKVGDRVKWSSQASGSWVEKVGTVVKVLRPAGQRYGYVNQTVEKEFPNHHKMFEGGVFYNHTDLHYLVEVRIGPKAKPRLYFPRPNKLEEVKK